MGEGRKEADNISVTFGAHYRESQAPTPDLLPTVHKSYGICDFSAPDFVKRHLGGRYFRGRHFSPRHITGTPIYGRRLAILDARRAARGSNP